MSRALGKKKMRWLAVLSSFIADGAADWPPNSPSGRLPHHQIYCNSCTCTVDGMVQALQIATAVSFYCFI